MPETPAAAPADPPPPPPAAARGAVRWAKVIDHTSCIGCHACTTACKSENEVPVGVTRTYVKYVEVGLFPQVRRTYQVTRCNQCDDAPCTTACPTAAMFRRDDGIVDFDKSICIGCKACIAACPYDAIFINPDDGAAEKCNFCAHRLDIGLEPACVVVCPTEAIRVGDLADPTSPVARIVAREPVAVRRPEKETRPKLFYQGAHQATLDPLAARRPGGSLLLWGEQGAGADLVASGHPRAPSCSAAALLAYDVPHRVPWDWRVSLYTVTKGAATGAYLVPLLLLASGWLSPAGLLWAWAAPLVGGAFLALTVVLLICDLEHPERVLLLLRRPQWRSWLVRGGCLLAGYGLALALHAAASLAGRADLRLLLAAGGLPLAVLTAVYTAWLFAQAKGRDLWQSPLLPPHLLVQAALAGAAALAPAAAGLEPAALKPLLSLLALACGAHLALVAGEVSLPHATAHGRLAVDEMVWGRYRWYFWVGAALVAAGLAAPFAALAGAPALGVTAGLAALAGLAAHEHAYVQAGQAVPLA